MLLLLWASPNHATHLVPLEKRVESLLVCGMSELVKVANAGLKKVDLEKNATVLKALLPPAKKFAADVSERSDGLVASLRSVVIAPHIKMRISVKLNDPSMILAGCDFHWLSVMRNDVARGHQVTSVYAT